VVTPPRFTVLLPTHNRDDVVGFAIESVLRQSEADFELFVVGDGCTDATASVLERYVDTRIRWFDLPKAPGFGYANRNVALREARGELIAYIAHDDLMLADHLSALGEAFLDPAIEWAYSRPLWVGNDGLVVPFAVDLRKPDQFARFMGQANTIPASCVMHRRDSRLAGPWFWPEDVATEGDWTLWKAITGQSADGANLAYVPMATTLHFRADWRRDRTWGPPPLDAWLRAATENAHWPAALRVPVAGAVTPQEAFTRLMESDPAWPAALRAGVTEAVDDLAWSTAGTLPSVVDGLIGTAFGLADTGSHHAAVEITDHLLRVAPYDARVHLARGVGLLGQGRLSEAEMALRSAIELEPALAEAHSQLSHTLAKMGNPAAAFAVVREAIAIAPAATLHAHLGNMLANADQLEDAEHHLREALRLDPRLTSAAHSLAALIDRRERQPS